MSELKTIRLLAPLFRGRRWALPAIVVLGSLASLSEGLGLSLVVPLLETLNGETRGPIAGGRLGQILAWLVDALPDGNPLPYIAGLIVAMTVLKGVLRYGHSILSGRLNSEVTDQLRRRLFSRIIHSSQPTRDQAGSGRLMNLLANDTWHTSDAITLFSNVVISLCSLLVFGGLLLALSFRLTVVIVVGVVVVSTVIRLVTMRVTRLGQAGVDANAALSEHMLDALDGVKEIQTYGLAGRLQTGFNRASGLVRSVFFKLDLLHQAVSPLSEILYVGLILGVLLVGSSSLVSVPTIIVFLLVLYRLQPHLRQLDSGRMGLAALAPSVEAVTLFLNSAEQPSVREAPGRWTPPRRCIMFDQVSFNYGHGRDAALENVSFEIPAGKITSIVGRSGSGKTTVISLLCRFYEPARGRILLDGAPLSAIDRDSWRGGIAWVDQHAHLFGATVAENIRYGRLDATDEEIRQAAREAGAEMFIEELPDGFATRIGTGGTQLSSGQVQRIALARAFVRNPAILILDEATNALDSLSEQRIRMRLRQTAGETTVILVSHRMATASMADHVVVLDSGQVSAAGPPAVVRARQGIFSAMHQLQHVE